MIGIGRFPRQWNWDPFSRIPPDQVVTIRLVTTDISGCLIEVS